jgi:NAD(P)-dependent dehydrogenase (short-subunit alcohol dehydrogenase family)
MTSHAENTVLVMGASSPVGIGAAIARYFRDAGHRVLISARSEAGLAAVADELGVAWHSCDITDAASVDEFYRWLAGQGGVLRSAVFATGQNHFTPLSRYEAEPARSCVETNFLGALTFMRKSAEAIAATSPDGGSITLLSSLTASRPAFGTAVYAGTKAGLEQAIRVAALEYAGAAIRVNGIAPGMTRTDMTEMMFDNPNLEQAVLREIPLGRMGTSEDIASAALWLADPQCFMTGETLAVNGGAELRRVPTLEEIMG